MNVYFFLFLRNCLNLYSTVYQNIDEISNQEPTTSNYLMVWANGRPSSWKQRVRHKPVTLLIFHSILTKQNLKSGFLKVHKTIIFLTERLK